MSTSSKQHTCVITAVAYSPDDEQVVSGDIVGTVNIWDASDWSLLSTKVQDQAFLQELQYSPDGQVIVWRQSAVPRHGSDTHGTFKFWNACGSEPLGERDGQYCVLCTVMFLSIRTGVNLSPVRTINPRSTFNAGRSMAEHCRSSFPCTLVLPPSVFIIWLTVDR